MSRIYCSTKICTQMRKRSILCMLSITVKLFFPSEHNTKQILEFLLWYTFHLENRKCVWSSGSNVCASPEKEKQGPLLAVAFHTDIFISFFFSFCTQAECVSQIERNSGNSVNLTVRFKYKNYSCTPLQRAESSGSCAQLYIKKSKWKAYRF